MTINLNLLDSVIYTTEAPDHESQLHCDEDSNIRRLVIGEEYRVVELLGSEGTIIGIYNRDFEQFEPNEHLEEICLEGTEWWIPASCVTPVEALQLGEHWRVIRKIKQIDETRKLMGYKY